MQALTTYILPRIFGFSGIFPGGHLLWVDICCNTFRTLCGINVAQSKSSAQQ